ALSLTPGIKKIDVMTAQQMFDVTLPLATSMDIFIAAAAVADYRVANMATQKIKKSTAPLRLDLMPNEDIVSAVTALPQKPFVVGFALETDQLLENAHHKLQKKNLDMVIANLVGDDSGFDTDSNA